jgi:hypothetical protein
LGKWKKKTPEEKARSEELRPRLEQRIREGGEASRRRREAQEERLRRIEARLDELVDLLNGRRPQETTREPS